MISRFVRTQLTVFAVVGVVAIIVIGMVYAKVPQLLGVGQRTVYAQFSDGAGLYSNAQVTYNGVAIGKVTGVTADKSGALATMSVSDSYQIPADVEAEVQSVSPIGEQYIGLVPTKAGGPLLTDGATIPLSHTTVPVQIGTFLDNVNSLLQSVPQGDLQTTLGELSAAFNGTGGSLQQTLQQGEQLLQVAKANITPTQKLITTAGPLLDTQTATSAQIRSLVASLDGFTGQVQASDGDIADLTQVGTQMMTQVNSLFQNLEPTLPILLANLVSTEQVLVTYNPALQEILVIYPRVTTQLISATKFNTDTDGNSTIGLDFRLIAQDPPPCYTGFTPASDWPSPTQTSFPNSSKLMYCQLPQDNPSVVRGARNTPCYNDPGKRAATVQQCEGVGYKPEAESDPAISSSSALGSLTSGSYDTSSGIGASPDGQYFSIGGIGSQAPQKSDLTWQQLVLSPIGR
jgi:phospholipid/cholesterol/gamma-HCH transport system substrate-binding protein